MLQPSQDQDPVKKAIDKVVASKEEQKAKLREQLKKQMEDEYQEKERLKRERLNSKNVEIEDSSISAQELEKKIEKDFSPPIEEVSIKETQKSMAFAEQLANQLGNFQLEKNENDSTADMTEEKKEPPKKKRNVNVNSNGPASNLRSRIQAFQNQNKVMKKPKVGVVYDEEMLLHRLHREYHPERPERVQAIYLNLIKKNIWDSLVHIDSIPATDDILALAHSQAHIQKVKDTLYNNKPVKGQLELQQKGENTNRYSQDTYENKFTAQAAYLAAGGTVEAIRALCGEQAVNPIDSIFAIVRPPGHHAHCSAIGGFCFFNNVAVAARVAQKEFNKRKMCIFDWDIHVGDGTSNVFYNDDTVLYISIHRFDMGKFFPGPKGKLEMIGECKGKGYNIQFPFNMPQKNKDDADENQNVIGDMDYIFVCENFLFPIIREFGPDMIIISAGFDSAKGDPLGEIAVTPVGYAWMTQGLRNIQSCIAVVLEGGYSLEALEVSSEAVIKVLQNHPKDEEAFRDLMWSYGQSTSEDSYEKLAAAALLHPRYSFRVTISNLAKLLKKTWGKVVEDLIFEKPRRKSSAQSKQSDQSDHCVVNTPGLLSRSRLNSMDDNEPKSAKTPGLEGEHHNLNAIIQVDDPIDEQDEGEEETINKKHPKKKGKGKKK